MSLTEKKILRTTQIVLAFTMVGFAIISADRAFVCVFDLIAAGVLVSMATVWGRSE